MNIRHDSAGNITEIGTEVDGAEIDESILPGDFFATFALGKYHIAVRENTGELSRSGGGVGRISIVEDRDFVAPERQIYKLEEIRAMSKEQLLELQAKIEILITQK